MILARMEGAGNNDAWQFATTWDLNTRLGIVVSLLTHNWKIAGLVMFGALFHGHVLWVGSLVVHRISFLWDDPAKVQSKDRVQRQVREQQQQLLAEEAERKAAELDAKKAAGMPAGKLDLAQRAAKYAPNVYRDLAGHDWDGAGEEHVLNDEADGGAGVGSGLRQRKGKAASREMDGEVIVLRGMKEWGEVRDAAKTAGRLLAVLYVREDAGEAGEAVAGRHRQLASTLQHVTFARMKADEFLEDLSTHVGRFSGRFPVLHLYDKGLKVEQVTGNDMSQLEDIVTKAVSSRASSAAAAASGSEKAKTSSGDGPSWAAVGGAEAGAAERKGGRDACLPAAGTVGEVANGREWDKILQAAGPRLVVVDFTATWCGPCQRIKSDYHRLAATYTDAIFLQVDVDQCDDVAGRSRVTSMPTFQFYQRTSKVHQVTGANIPKVEEAVLRLM